MPDQATIAIVVQDGGGAGGGGGGGSGRGPRSPRESPADTSSDWLKRLGGQPQTNWLAERMGQAAEKPATEVIFKKGMEPPAVRAIMPPRTGASPEAESAGVLKGAGEKLGGITKELGNLGGFGQSIGKLGASFGNLTKMAGSLGTSLATVGTAAAFVALPVAAAAVGLKEFQRVQQAGINARLAETNVITAKTSYERRLAELNRPLDIRQTPVIGGVAGSVGEFFRDIGRFFDTGFTKGQREQLLTDRQKRENAFLAEAQRIAPYSGQVSAGLARAEVARIQGALEIDKITGGIHARHLEAQAKFEEQSNIREAKRQKQELETDTKLKEAQAQLAELANRDPRRAEDIWKAIDKSLTNGMGALYKVMQENRDAIRAMVAQQARERQEKPLGWWNDILKGALGKLPTTPHPNRLGGGDISPMFMNKPLDQILPDWEVW